MHHHDVRGCNFGILVHLEEIGGDVFWGTVKITLLGNWQRFNKVTVTLFVTHLSQSGQ